MQKYILKMEQIEKNFPGVKALQKVNLDVLQGEVHALLGENGAGKSTLLKILAGAYSKDSGEIFVDSVKQEIRNPKHAQELGIAIIYQEFSILPHLSIAENIFLGQLPRKKGSPWLIDWSYCYKESQRILAGLGLNIDPRTQASRLKVAEQQMVEIAKALSQKAKIIIMDEPTAPLTLREIDKLFEVVRMLKKQGVSIIYVSHRLAEVKEICDRATVLRDGKNIGTVNVSETDVKDWINMMVGRELDKMFPKVSVPIGREVLSVNNITIPGKLKNVSFKAYQGEILGIAGLVGAGRTELARAIFGADQMQQGEIYIDGKPVSIQAPQAAIRNSIGLVPEDRKGQGLVLSMNVKDNITLANIRGIGKGKLNLALEKDVANKYVQDLNIVTPSVYQQTVNLSGGNQQKVVLAKWLFSKCKILIVDEPTRGIDVGAKVEIYELLNELVKSGSTVIMISSELPELIGICDRIIVLHEGEITGELRRDEFTEEAIMLFATGTVVKEIDDAKGGEANEGRN